MAEDGPWAVIIDAVRRRLLGFSNYERLTERKQSATSRKECKKLRVGRHNLMRAAFSSARSRLERIIRSVINLVVFSERPDEENTARRASVDVRA